MKLSPSDVADFVLPTDYPATRDELVTAARQRGAPEELVATLKGLPDREYRTPVEIFVVASAEGGERG